MPDRDAGGPNIGLIGALSTFARVNEFGFIETSPYRRSSTAGHRRDRHLADEEEEYVVAQANALNPDGTFAEDRVLVRRSPAGRSSRTSSSSSRRDYFAHHRDLGIPRRSEVQLMDVSPADRLGGHRAIPFLEHDDANRALMGANMQRQAVPLVQGRGPYIGTGIEAAPPVTPADMVLAIDDGTVTEVDGDSITVEYKSAGRKVVRLPQVRALEPGHLHQPEARVPRATG